MWAVFVQCADRDSFAAVYFYIAPRETQKVSCCEALHNMAFDDEMLEKGSRSSNFVK